MKATKSKDGIMRADFKVTARLSLEDFAVLLTRSLMWHIDYGLSDHETIEERDSRVKKLFKSKVSKMTLKQLKDQVQEAVLSDGIQNPHYSISDEGLDYVANYLSETLSNRFKIWSN